MKTSKKVAKKAVKKSTNKKTVLNGITAKKVAIKPSNKVEQNPFLQLRDIISKLKPKGNRIVYPK